MSKVYKMTDILMKLREEGITPHTKSSFIRLEKEGRLTFPKVAGDRGDRVLTEGMLLKS